MPALKHTVRTVAREADPPATAPDYLGQQVERSWKKELRHLRWFGLRDGMSVLDLGCGPGHFTARLAEELPHASFTAIDPDERSLEQARRRLAGRALVVQARAEDTGLPSGAFDFVLARLLFQHLPQPEQAAREAYRLLRPGGRLVVTDVDDALFGIVEPRMAGLKRLLTHYARSQESCGGNRHVGRHLVRWLRSAGFVDADIDALATHSDQAGMAACLPQFDPAPLRSLVDSGHLSRLEVPILRLLHRRHERQQPFALVLNFMACGTKPDADAPPR